MESRAAWLGAGCRLQAGRSNQAEHEVASSLGPRALEDRRIGLLQLQEHAHAHAAAKGGRTGQPTTVACYPIRQYPSAQPWVLMKRKPYSAYTSINSPGVSSRRWPR